TRKTLFPYLAATSSKENRSAEGCSPLPGCGVSPQNPLLTRCRRQRVKENPLEEPYELANTSLVKYRHTGTPDHYRRRSLSMAATCRQLKRTNYPASYSNNRITMRHIRQINSTAVDTYEPCLRLDTQHKPHRHLRRTSPKLVPRRRHRPAPVTVFRQRNAGCVSKHRQSRCWSGLHRRHCSRRRSRTTRSLNSRYHPAQHLCARHT